MFCRDRADGSRSARPPHQLSARASYDDHRAAPVLLLETPTPWTPAHESSVVTRWLRSCTSRCKSIAALLPTRGGRRQMPRAESRAAPAGNKTRAPLTSSSGRASDSGRSTGARSFWARAPAAVPRRRERNQTLDGERAPHGVLLKVATSEGVLRQSQRLARGAGAQISPSLTRNQWRFCG